MYAARVRGVRESCGLTCNLLRCHIYQSGEQPYTLPHNVPMLAASPHK